MLSARDLILDVAQRLAFGGHPVRQLADLLERLLISGVIEADASGGVYSDDEKFILQFLIEGLLKRRKAAEPRTPELIEHITGEENDPFPSSIVRIADRIDE